MANNTNSVPQIFVQSDSPESKRKEVTADEAFQFKIPDVLNVGTLDKKIAPDVRQGKSMTSWMQKVAQGYANVRNPNRIISDEELRSHNKRNDVWMAIKGKVFDVTDYVEYHPGGATYLMKGAGQDATKMFNTFHAYVNLEAILKGRQVGIYIPGGSSGSKAGTSDDIITAFDQTNQSVNYAIICDKRNINEASWSFSVRNRQFLTIQVLIGSQEIWMTNLKLVETLRDDKINFHFDNNFKKLILTLQKPSPSKPKEDLRSLVTVDQQQEDVHILNVTVEKFDLEAKLKNSDSDVTGCECDESSKSTWPSLGLPQEHHGEVVSFNAVPDEFYPAKIVLKRIYADDIYIFGIAVEANAHIGVPTLWHLSLDVKGVAKPYTPIPLLTKRLEEMYKVDSASSRGQILYFYIKIYPKGKLTPLLDNIKVNAENEIMIGDRTGYFDPEFLVNTDRLVLLAGGTGITPFIGLIQFLMEKRQLYSVQQVILVHSVTHERELLWPDAMKQISSDGEWFFYKSHVTKAKDSTASNHLSLSVVEDVLRKIPKYQGLFLNEPLYTVKAMACGPQGYLETCEQIFDSLGVAPTNRLILS